RGDAAAKRAPTRPGRAFQIRRRRRLPPWSGGHGMSDPIPSPTTGFRLELDAHESRTLARSQKRRRRILPMNPTALFRSLVVPLVGVSLLSAAVASDEIPGAPQPRPIVLIGGTVHPVSGPS